MLFYTPSHAHGNSCYKKYIISKILTLAVVILTSFRLPIVQYYCIIVCFFVLWSQDCWRDICCQSCTGWTTTKLLNAVVLPVHIHWRTWPGIGNWKGRCRPWVAGTNKRGSSFKCGENAFWIISCLGFVCCCDIIIMYFSKIEAADIETLMDCRILSCGYTGPVSIHRKEDIVR